MKRYLLFIISMFCVSIGTWADPTEFGTRGTGDETPKSTWEKTGTLVTITINVESDVTADWALPTGLTLGGVNTVKVITGPGVTLHGAYNNGLHHLWCLYNSVVLDLSEAVVAYTNVTINNVVTPTLEMAQGDNLKNLVVPNGHASDPQTVLISNVYYSPTTYDSNNYGISETTVNASLKLTSNLTALSNISSSATKMKVLHDLPNAIDFSGVLTSSQTLDLTNVTTTGTTATNPITVVDGVKVVCISNDVKKRITGTADGNITVASPVISCTAENLDDELEKLDNAGVAPTSITITSSETALTAEQMAHFSTLNGLTYLSLEADAGTNIASLVLPSSLEKLTLPRSSTNPESLVTSAMKTHSNLLYVYAPYSGDQNANQTVADYVWVKAGGLWQAMHNEARLKTAVYVKVASDVANGVQLNELDAKFGDHGIMAQTSYNTENYPWQYIDLSATFFGVAATNANTAPHNKGYRIILPDNLTGDHMAIFASKPETDISDTPDRGYRGKVAAVYSYNGTKLSLLEITDNTYHTNALADSRIVRSGTTEIKVISGSYGGTTFSKLGPKLLVAINAADDTPGDNTTNHITKVTVAVGTGIYTAADEIVSEATIFAFNNDNLTNLDLSYTNNSKVTIDVSGCANLTNFQMNEATVAAVDAHGITTLATVSLGHTTVGSAGVGDVNLSGTNLATQLEVDLAKIAGTLNVSNTQATSFDFTQLTAQKVDASNTTSLTSLNINGISLNGDVFTPNDDTQKDGKIDVTRSSNNYSGLTITKADAFNTSRIIPSTGLTITSIAEAKVEISVEGNLLSARVDGAVTTWNNDNPIIDPSKESGEEGYSTPNTMTKANVQILHVTGTLTADDITYIKTYLTALQLLDLTEATFDSDDIVDKIVLAGFQKTMAIVLPVTTNSATAKSSTEADKIADVKKLQDAGFECVAYYTDYKTSPNTTYTHNGTHVRVQKYRYVSKEDPEAAGGDADYDADGNYITPGWEDEKTIHNGTHVQIEDGYEYISKDNPEVAYEDADYDGEGHYIAPTETTTYDRASSRLNVYAYNGTIGNLTSLEPAIIDSYTSITFLRKYQNTDVSSTAHGYPEATPSLLTALSTMSDPNDIPSIDMTWLDISKLGTDFSGLNSYFIIIPQNSTAEEITRNGITYNNDFTVEDDTDKASETYTPTHVSTASYKYYKYHHNTYAVSTYKSNVAPYAANAYFGGDALSYDNGYGHKNTTATLLYLRKDYLGDIIEYLPEHMKDAHILSIVGTITNEYDRFMSGLNKMENPCIDLTRATIADISILNSLDNDHVESISIPYKTVTNFNATPANDVYGLSDLPTLSSTDCPNLKGVGMMVKSSDMANAESKKGRLIYQSFKEDGMANQMLMLHALNRNERQYKVSRMVIAGPVNARDLANRTDGIDDNGHLMTSVDANNIMTVAGTGNSGSLNGYAAVMDYWDLSKVTLPNYNTRDGKDYCFDNSTHTYATSDASTDGFSYQNDLCFSKIGLVPDDYDPFSCELPTDASVWRLPTDAFYNGHGMTELNLPFNYQYIGNGAFTDTYLTHITTTDAINGNIVDNGEHTYTLSANLKEIGDNPGVGKALDANQTVFPQNREVYDVYVLATDVPKCYANAFAANVLYGWGGFQGGTFPYCRDKYINGSNWFCVLRYPYKAAWDAAHSTSGARESGFDLASRRVAPTTTPNLANGIDSYEEMEAAYTDVYKIYTKKEQTGAVDANGNAILWPTFSELQRVSAQALTNEVWHDWDTAYNGQQEVNTSSSYDSGTYTTLKHEADNDNHYDFEEYKGWHQFVLTQATYVESVEQNATEREYERKGWYTFCIPYDLTEDQVYEMLGVPYSTAQYTNKVDGNEIKEAGDLEGNERILPDIRTLKQVERTPGTPNVVSLRLTDNLTGAISGKYSYWSVTNNETEPTSDYVECGTKGDPDAVVIKGGYPYYIQPYLLKGETVKNLGKYVMSRYGDKFKKTASCVNHDITMEYLGDKNAAPKDRLATLKFAKPLEEHKIWAKYDDNDDSNDPYEFHDKDHDIKYNYTFVGQFWDQKLPRYCYYTMEGTGNWYRLAANKNYTWNAYKCVIMATQEVDDTETHPQSGKFRKNSGDEGEIISFYPTIATGTADLLDDALRLAFLDGLDDYDFGSSSARRYMFTFDDVIMDSETDGQVTAIETLDGNSIVPATGKVYNMAGQHVGNSLESLPKGMYIANGKKVIVK